MMFLGAGALLQSPCDRPAAAAAVDLGWQAYRRGAIDEAARRFAAADTACAGFPGAATGLGFVRLRQGDAAGAERSFTAGPPPGFHQTGNVVRAGPPPQPPRPPP